ncbi:MAG: hypothetical protein V1701_04135 [Planctomycetota bacterium]
MSLKLNYPAVISVLALVGLAGYFGCKRIMGTGKPAGPDKAAVTAAGEQYSKSLADVLVLDVKVEDGTARVFITNKSQTESVPSEKYYKVLVCATELITADNKPLNSYSEHFKPAVLANADNPGEQQIAPATTVKFGYDLTIPHGIIRVKLTYEDFFAAGPGETPPAVALAEKEIRF